MWSGPRNISTAMMRSWENRSDSQVVDEPFYAYYLQQTQSPHPCFEEVLASQSDDYNTVVAKLTQGDLRVSIEYQKHMTHHMLPGIDLAWTKTLQHCFLIRSPAQVVNSYSNSRGVCSVEDIGIKRQFQLYQVISDLTKQDIPIIDSNDVLQNPQGMLKGLCEKLGIAFSTKMLSWPKGRRASDGVWATHWYKSVEDSTGFAPFSAKEFGLNEQQQAVVDQVQPYYQQLFDKRMRVE